MGARPCLKINSIDYITYVDQKGLNWECNDLDSEESGRNLEGDMTRFFVKSKHKLSIKLIPLKTEAFSTLSQAITTTNTSGTTNYLQVTFLNPRTGVQEVHTMYSSGMKAATMYDDGVDCWWENGEFSLIEK